MKKLTFVLLAFAALINLGLALSGKEHALNFIPAALLIFAAFATYMADQKPKQ